METIVDIELGFDRQGNGMYKVDFRCSMPGNDADTRLGQGDVVLVQIDVDALGKLTEKPDTAPYAKLLSDSVFVPGSALSTIWAESLANAQSKNLPVRLRLLIDGSAPELHSLRWELLLNPKDQSPIANNQNILFSRFLTSNAWQAIPRKPKGNLRALVVISNPSDLKNMKFEPIPPERELGIVKAGLPGVEIVEVAGEAANDTLNALAAQMESAPFDILYLVCHGYLLENDSILVFQDAQGKLDKVKGSDFFRRLKNLPAQNLPRLALLVSCQSAGSETGDTLKSIGPRLAEVGIPAVIAMQANLAMDAASELLPAFFEALNQSGQIDLALSAARAKMIKRKEDYWVPVLFMRLKSGRLWYVPGFGEADKEARTLPALVQNISDWACTPIIGPGLPEFITGSKRDTARAWADAYKYPLGEIEVDSLPRVAQYLTIQLKDSFFPITRLRSELRTQLQSRYKDLFSGIQLTPKADLEDLINTVWLKKYKNPLDSYCILSSLNLPIYITTNYDTLLETALKEDGKTPTTLVCPWNDKIQKVKLKDAPLNNTPLVFHLYGRWNDENSIVMTEDQYFDFMIGFTRNKQDLPPDLLLAMTDSSLMFLGFQTESWDFRALFRAILAQPGIAQMLERAKVSTQLEPDDESLLNPMRARKYFEDYFGKIEMDVFWGTAEEFIRQLNAAMPKK